MQDIIYDSYVGLFRVGTVYYFLDAPISDFTKNPRPDIKLIHYIEELAPYYIDSLGFSKFSNPSVKFSAYSNTFSGLVL